MDDDRWDQLKENIKKKFEVEEETTEDLIMETGDGPIKQGEQNILIVTTPMGKMKLTREIRPRVLDKKFHYTHRAGDTARIEYKFSETEKTYKLKIYKWDEDEEEWDELKEDSLDGLI